MNTNFSLETYNEAQKQAITEISNPLLLISGAGTGKTHVLTGRILHLILNKGISADQILALTFTEKATNEMLDRVEKSLPLGSTPVCIKTFHSFCEQVLRERGFEIGIPTDYALLREVDTWMFLKRNVFAFNLDYYLPIGNPQRFLKALQEYFSRLQDEDITPEEYLDYVQAAQKKGKTEGEMEIVKKHKELAQAYETYRKLLLKEGAMDFASLISNTLRLFEKRPSVLAEYQNRFRYILVDEFQDTNFEQNKLVAMLALNHRNIFVVSDDDQSIYKWRGASLTNIQYFRKMFPEAKTLVLNKNYRSSQIILDLAYHVIQKNNPDRLEVQESVSKKLVTVVKRKQITPEVRHFTTINEEVKFIVKKASSLMKQGLDTAILVRTNALATPFLNELRKNALKFQHFSTTTLFTRPGVKDCIAFLRVIGNPRDDLALFRCLQLKIWNIPMEDILELNRRARAQRLSLYELLTGKGFAGIKLCLASCIEYSRDHTVSEVTGKFLKDSGYLLHATKEKSEALTDIASFGEHIADFEARNRETSVNDFLTYIQLLEETGSYRSENPELDQDAIKILTIHAAKGLEFDAVFVPGLSAGKFPSITRRDPFDIPEELIKEQLPKTDHHIAEERRLFYVACTRAREILKLSYSDFYDGKKQWKVSPFILEAFESGKVTRSERSASTNQASSVQSLEASAPTRARSASVSINQTSLIQSSEASAPRKHKPLKLALPRLSYSQIDTFRTCPLKYQFRYLFNIPAPMPAVVNFGTSIHNTLKDFYTYLKKYPKEIGKNLLPLFQKYYEKNWVSYGYETQEIHDHQKKRGMELLEQFYVCEKRDLRIPAYIEKQFTLQIDNLIITGRIDRIDQLADGTYEVIDYKTGDIASKDLKNDLQLTLYALACKENLKIPVSRLSLYSLSGMEKVSTTRNEEQLAACKEDLRSYASEIRESDFSPTPGYHCSYCDYRLICPAAAPMRV